jgi:predicted outer membrane repeat protein
VFVVSADVPYLPATTQVLIRKPDIIITSSLTHLTGSGGSTQGSGPTLALACDQAPGPLIQIRWVAHKAWCSSSSFSGSSSGSSSDSSTITSSALAAQWLYPKKIDPTCLVTCFNNKQEHFLYSSAQVSLCAVFLCCRSKGVQIFGLSFVGCPLGALQISASQEVYVQGCRCARNAATAVRATNSLLWLHSCTFSDNAHLAPLGPGGRMPSLAALAQAAGGAMHLIASRVLITGSTFVRNTASSVGGAVWVEGLYKEAAASGTCWASATLALSDVVLTNNSAIGPGGAVLGNNTSIHMEKVALRGNSARFGGGLYLTNSSSARLVDCRGSSNTVASSGSALYVEGAGSLLEVSRSNFTRNSATLLGGVVVVKQGAKAVLRDSSFSNNVAALAAGVVYAKEAQLVVEGATLTNNSASRDGGGLYCASACAWTVRRSTFVRNTCSGNGGALFGWNMAANVSASRFDNNSAGALGGAISMANSTVRVEDSTLLRNRANGKDAAGGGLYGQYVRFTLINNTLTDNMAAWGGGMYITNSTLSMTRDSLTDNSARQAGGGVYSLRTPSNVTGVRFDGNAAGLYGAGFYCQEGPCTLLRVRMQDQIAQVGAGGVYAAQGTLFLQNSTFVNCRAANEGAGVVLARRCTGVLVDGCNMTANSAVKGPGGAMQMVETLTVLITRSTITGNQVSGMFGMTLLPAKDTYYCSSPPAPVSHAPACCSTTFLARSTVLLAGNW